MSSGLQHIREGVISNSFFEEESSPSEKYEDQTPDAVANQITYQKMYNAKIPTKKKEDVSGFIQMYQRGVVSRIEKSKKIKEVKKQNEENEVKDMRDKPKINVYPAYMGGKQGFMARLGDYQDKHQSNMKKLQTQIEEKKLQRQKEIESELSKSKKATQNEVDKVVSAILEKDNMIKEKKRRLQEKILGIEHKECVFQPQISHSSKYKTILEPNYGYCVLSIEHKNYVKQLKPNSKAASSIVKDCGKNNVKVNLVKYLDKDPKSSLSLVKKQRIITSEEFRLGGKRIIKNGVKSNDHNTEIDIDIERRRSAKGSMISVNSLTSETDSLAENFPSNAKNHDESSVGHNNIKQFNQNKPKKSNLAVHSLTTQARLNKTSKVKFSFVGCGNHSDSSIVENARRDLPFFIPELNDE